MVAVAARFSAHQSAHAFFLHESLVFPLYADAWYCCATCKRRCTSEASTIAFSTTNKTIQFVWVHGKQELQDHSKASCRPLANPCCT